MHIQGLLFYREFKRCGTCYNICNFKLQIKDISLQDLGSVISVTDASDTPWLRQILPGYQKL